uniref:Cingulin like 1 n=1 Tax=Xiphophorus couchianus TaxID=32473 RepID=A0A3B5LVE0_9TELE
MESYRATSSGSQRGYTQPSRISRPSSNGAGSYGLSIRVQGIDGHPYVVLNNQDRGHHPDGNGYPDTEGSFIEHFQEYDFRGDKKAGSSDPFMEYRTQKMRHFSGPQNGLPESQAKKPSTLLNFQRHPELLQPYDPRSNSLNLEGFHSLPSRPAPQADTRIEYQNPYPKSEVRVPSRFRSSSLDRHLDRTQEENRQPPQTDLNTPQTKSPSLPSAQVPQPQSRAPTQPAQPAQPQIKPYLTTQPQPSPVSSPSSDQRKASPTSTRSANSSLERTHHDPDVLPLLRTDSGEPAQSCHSSLSSTSKSLIDEQMEALYTDAINRHENRRYIPFQPGSGRDIDTGSIPGVDELIEKFDGKDDGLQRRGRAGRRNRINPEDRKRSRSVDSAFGSRSDSSFMDEFGQSLGTSKERVLRPSQLRLQRTASGQDPGSTAVDGPSSRAISAPGSPQSSISKYTGSLRGYTKLQSRPAIPSFKSSEETPSSVGKVSTTSLSKLPPTADSKTSTGADVQATPDLLKGQQELSQQTHEETAKQILFSYLKEGSNDNDDVTNRKVNLVFEKIQTLKSRATASAQSDNKSVDLAAQTKALQEQNAELEKEIIELKRQPLFRSKVSNLIQKELQQELQRSLDECRQLKEKLAKTEAELNSSVEELFQVKMEREQHQTEIRDLQDQLSEMHDELDAAKRAAADGEKDVLMADMMQLKVEMQEVVMAKEEQEELLRRRERELAALKGALKDEVAAHDQEVDKMKEQYEKEISRLQMSLEEAKQNSAAVVREKAEVEAAKGQAEGQAGRLNQELERLRRRTNELENEVAKLNRIIDEAKLLESRLGDKAGRLEREKRQLEESLAEIREQEEEMSRANQMLNIRLEDVQKNLAKLDFENKELEDRLQEEKSQKEQFKNMKNNIEDERRLLDRTVEKLQREMSDIVEASQSSTRELQEQIDIYKEKNRRELAELQRLLKEKGQELEKLVLTTRTLQEKVKLKDCAICFKGFIEHKMFWLCRFPRCFLPVAHSTVKTDHHSLSDCSRFFSDEVSSKSNLSLANRRLERRVKEMMMQIEEEHHTMQDQKDQLNLRLKALKRQMDEAEETIDRLEHNKKKLHRELDEQQEANEQLNSQLKALRSEMRRKNTSAPLLNNLDDDDDDDDVSTDGEMYFSSSGYKRSSSQENSLSGFGV